jgi:NAD(P)H-hydrate repair Nnr-like enzyme with NAD(P)H-hydrate dehydratase domain
MNKMYVCKKDNEVMTLFGECVATVESQMRKKSHKSSEVLGCRVILKKGDLVVFDKENPEFYIK